MGHNISSILIKGLPGTGKTTLAMELLRLKGGGVYFSTRVSEQKLLSHMPGVRPIGKELIREFIDLRLGSAEILLKRILDELEEGLLIVLDSWDSIAKEMEHIERLKVEKSIVAMAEASGSTVVFVSEEPHLTTTDYLVDAIVKLRDETYEGRRLRVIEWDKLRGRPILTKNNLFTLHEGRFTILWGYEALEEDQVLDLYQAFKAFSVILLELDPNVDQRGIEPFTYALISEFTAKGYSLVAIPIGMETPTTMLNRVKKLGNRIYVGGFYDYERGDIFRLDNTSAEGVSDALIKKGEIAGKGCLYIVGCDVLRHIFGGQGLVKLIFKLSRKVRERGALLVLLVGQGLGVAEELANLSDVHIRFRMVDNALLGQMVKPQGNSLYHIRYSYEDDLPKVETIPIR